MLYFLTVARLGPRGEDAAEGRCMLHWSPKMMLIRDLELVAMFVFGLRSTTFGVEET